MDMVDSPRDYVRRGGGHCHICGEIYDSGANGLAEWGCPKCRPIYTKEVLQGKKYPPRVRETETPFDFNRWAIIKRAEADAAEAGWSIEQARALVLEIVDYWVSAKVSAQKTADEQRALANARRAAISARSTY